MLRVQVRMDKADTDRFGSGSPEPACNTIHFCCIKMNFRCTVPDHSFRHFANEVAWYQGLRDLDEKIIHVKATPSPHFEHIAEPLGYHKSRYAALALDNRVDDQCRAMNNAV